MADIATLPEFASFIQTDVDTATANLLLLDLAQGQVADQIGVRDPWPATAKTIALEAAKRAYVNPEGVRAETVGGIAATYPDRGVFLTEDEVARLQSWLNDPAGGASSIGQPQGCFPLAHSWPDPAEPCWSWPT